MSLLLCFVSKTHFFLRLSLFDMIQIGYYQYSEKILRCHLGLFVPPDCAIKVNGEVNKSQNQSLTNSKLRTLSKRNLLKRICFDFFVLIGLVC
jgi:hypothetical protein